MSIHLIKLHYFVYSCNLRILFIRHRHAGPRACQYDCVVLLFSVVSENTTNHYYFDTVLFPDWKAESKYFTRYPNVWVYYLGAHFIVVFFSGETKMKSMDIGGGCNTGVDNVIPNLYMLCVLFSVILCSYRYSLWHCRQG
jgi:hypothetical protein